MHMRIAAGCLPALILAAGVAAPADTPPPAMANHAIAVGAATQPQHPLTTITLRDPVAVFGPTTQPTAATQPATAPTTAPTAGATLSALAKKLDALVDGRGALRPHVKAQMAADVANEAGNLAENLTSDGDQLRAARIQMHAYYAMAGRALSSGDPILTSLRLHQLRSIAQQTRPLHAPGAREIADFYLAAADLLDLQLNEDPLAVHQIKAIERLTRFVKAHPIEAGATDRLSPQGAAIRWNLLRLDLQAGRTQQAARLVDELARADAAVTPEQTRWLNEARGQTSLLGKQASLRVSTVGGERWSLADHRGSVVLVVFFDKASHAAADVLSELKTRAPELTARGLKILALDVGDNERWLKKLDVPFALGSIGAASPLLQQFSVGRLPQLILLDATGRIHAVGSTLAILDQAEPMLPALQGETGQGG